MRAVGGLGSLLASADAVLCDVFGTIHDARGAFAPAIDALARFRAAGGTVLLLSNAAAPAPALRESLRARGIPDRCCDGILTSADVARGMLARRAARRIHHIGLEGERQLFDGLSIDICPVADADLVVCTGCPDGPLPERDLRAAAARRLDLLCTNPDTAVVAGSHPLRFAGLVAARYEALGGTVVATGKPGALIYAEALMRIAALRGAAPDPRRILAIGDSLHLDVAGALACGCGALWVAPADVPTPPWAGAAHRAPALAW